MSRYTDPSRRYKPAKPTESTVLQAVRSKFAAFLSLLEVHNQVMSAISDMEEKSQGEYLFDLNYIRTRLAEIRNGISRLIQIMIDLGGNTYLPLKQRFGEIGAAIDASLPWCRTMSRDRFTMELADLCKEQACNVGSKMAQLGEMKTRLDITVPDGFAITAWGCRFFRENNNLEDRIGRRISSVDFRSYQDLQRVSEEIQKMIMACPVPEELGRAIRDGYHKLKQRHPEISVAMRSSALGEDTWFSFAGQYATFLNVQSDQLLDSYRAVLASKFTPKAIYYFLSHSLQEADLSMGVGCVQMVNSRSSGVIYTRNPVNPEDNRLLIHSVWGLGKYLVDGRISPDVFALDRNTGEVTHSEIAEKRIQLVLSEGGGTVEQPVPDSNRKSPSINQQQIEKLRDCALRIEKHYNQPQDIEWAIDAGGEIYILQTRPLKIVMAETGADEVDTSGYDVLRAGGLTVCPGASIGRLFLVTSESDLPRVPDHAVLMAPQPFPGLITAMGKVSAIITETGGSATHMATLAREYRIPTLTAVHDLLELPAGETVTVDATGGTIYRGTYQELVTARQPDYDLFADMDIFRLLEDVLVHVAPLHLLRPDGPEFTATNCKTLHDITRFIHQKAIEEMFYGGLVVGDTQEVIRRLATDIPLTVDMIYLDREVARSGPKREVPEDKIGSRPMEAFWSGLLEEGWPRPVRPQTVSSFPSVLGRRGRQSGYSQNSFAVLSREYMILHLRMGYHFTTIEAFCAQNESKNYVRFQHKQGGASLARRIRRVKVISDLLDRLGFHRESKSDFMQAQLTHLPQDRVIHVLRLLGRITIMTKQLDMALSTDAIAEWYIEDFARRLGLPPRRPADD